MKPLNPIVVWLADATLSVAILVGGLSLAIALDAPFWLVPVFFAPLAIYLHFRAEPRGRGFRWFLAICLLAFCLVAFPKLVPPDVKPYIVLTLLIYVGWSYSRSLKHRADETG
jgi:hypothetical protein